MSFDSYQLSELMTLLTDYHSNGSYKTLKQNVTILYESSYAVMIRATNLEHDDYDSSLIYVNKNAYNHLEKSKVFPNDLIMNKIGNAGSVYLMPDLQIPVTLAMNLFLIRINPEKANPIYVYIYLKLNELYVKQFCNGSVQKTITKEAIKNLEIKLPDRASQNKIVYIYETLTKKISLNKDFNKNLERLAQSIFKSWFVDFDPVHAKKLALEKGLSTAQAERAAMAIISGVCGPSDFAENFEEMDKKLSAKLSKMSKEKQEELAYTASLFPSEFDDSELGECPKGWKTESIYKFANIIYGAPFSSKKFTKEGEGKPLIRIRDLKTFSPQHWTTERHKKGHLVQPGDLLIGMDAEFRPTIWLGEEAYLNQRVMLIESTNQVSTAFMRFALEESMSFFERAKVGTTVIHLGKGDIDTIRLRMPSEQILRKYGQLGNNIFKKIVINQKEIKRLEQLRETLLPKLLTGDVDLSNINLEGVERE